VGGPLDGIVVLDLTHFLAGPYATLALVDMGATVIKVEDPERPDEGRTVGPGLVGDQSAYFLSLNWAKRSLCLRLASDAGRAALLRVVAGADAIVDNYRPGVMEKLRLAHRDLEAVNPGIVSCSLSGYGSTGPYADQPGYDYTIQAMSGVMSLTGEPDGPPGKAGISYVDHSGGLAAALAITAGLVERGRTGHGRHVDLSLLDVQISMLTYLAGWSMNAGFDAQRHPGGAHPSIVPAQTFATADGYVSIFVGNDPMWARLTAALDDPVLCDTRFEPASGRYQHRHELIDRLSAILAERPSQFWVDLLRSRQVPCAPVNTVAQALRDEQVVARQLVGRAAHPAYGEYRHTRGPVPLGVAVEGAPLLGEHTIDVLRESGLSDGEISALLSSGDALAP
jgi:crotonobetainyl-CoA:carnitine CoA-transferase CaiB-like acyl-CoA transferase